MKAHSSLNQASSPLQLTVASTLTLIMWVLGSQQSGAIAKPSPLIAPTSVPFTRSSNVSQGTDFANSVYILGAGDQIDLSVLGYPEFTGTKVILTDGTIAVPVIGNVKAAGRSPEVFAQEMKQRLRPFLKNPVVTVGVLNARPLLISVAGEVQRPGPIQLQSFGSTPSSSSNLPRDLPTVSAALVFAGGLTQNADIRKIALRRVMPTGESVTTTINLWDAVVSENASNNALLQDGDALFVPKLTAGDPLDLRLLARSTLAPKTVKVRVVGEVKKPGEVEVPPNSSVSSAVAIAGGPTDKAALKKVSFIRLLENGKVEQRRMDLSSLTDTEQIQDGDVVMVPKSTGSAVLDFTTQLFSPLGVLLNLLKK